MKDRYAVLRFLFWIVLCGFVGALTTSLIFYADLNSKIAEECWSIALGEQVNCDRFKLLRAFSGVLPGIMLGFIIARRTGPQKD